MMKRLLGSLVLAAVLALPLGVHAVSAASMTAMPTCAAGDPVVWVNTKSKVYHMQGDSYYGKTKSGKYACKSAADAMGAHASGKMKGMKKSSMTGGAMSGMSMASPMPGKHHRKKGSAMMQTSPSPLVPAPSATPTA